MLLVILLIVSLGVHEAAHAWAAWKCGDSTAKDLGRMTLNPIVHIDLFMTILLPALCLLAGAPVFGGAKPVPVNFHRLRKPWTDMMVVALAGPFSNFVLAIVFFALMKLFVTTGFYNDAAASMQGRIGDLLPRVLSAASAMNVLLFAFNLIPIPPLDGSRVGVLLLPESMRHSYIAIGSYGLLFIYALINFVPAFRHFFFFDVYYPLTDIVQQIASLGGRW